MAMTISGYYHMIQLINNYDILDQVVVIGCDLPLVLLVRKADSRLTTTQNMDILISNLAKAKIDWFISEYTTQAAENQMAALCVHQAYISPDLLLAAHLWGLPVWAWTVDRHEDIHRMLNLAEDAIITN